LDEKETVLGQRQEAGQGYRSTRFLQTVKQQYRHTKPIRGKDPLFENEEIEEHRNARLENRKPTQNQKQHRHENKNSKTS
jgi:hypothetical protein